MNKVIYSIILLNSSTEINVIIKRLMNMIEIIIRSKFKLKLIYHIDYDMNFDEICIDVEMNIENLYIIHHIFIITYADY